MSISVDPPAVGGRFSTDPSVVRLCKTARVLFALAAARTVPRALQEADAFAQRLGAELHLLRVVPHVDTKAPSPPRNLVQAVREAQRVLSAARHTRKLCDRMLHHELPSLRICVRLGTFVEQVAQRASELDAPLIVVPPGTMRLAQTVTELARRTDCPVLVPKGRASFMTLLAATDLEDPRTPVLQRAAEIGRELGAAVVALHSWRDSASGRGSPATLEQCRERLERAAGGFDARFEPIVQRALDPVQSILDQARAHDAGIIVVGTRPRPGGSLGSAAVQLVRRARRSVLVAPV
jgi:nucleotide-binding universal stress UspA family protein